MATITRYINPASTAGGDGTTNATAGANRAYASASEWEAAEQTDLVSDGDIHIVYCDDGVDSSARLIIDGWTTGASNYIEMIAQTLARNDGIARARSGVGYSFQNTSTGPFRVNEDFVRVIGIEVSTSNSPAVQVAGTPGGSSDIRFEDVLIVHTGTGSTYAFASNADYDVSLTSCLIVTDARAMDVRTGNYTVDHCGCYINGGTLGIVADDSATVTNTWVAGASSEDFWTGGSSPTGSHNASSDSSASTDYTSTITSFVAADEFVSPSATASTFDFELKLGNSLGGAGTGSGVEDIADTAFPSPADIGSFAYIVAGGFTPKFNPLGGPIAGPLGGPI